jgi:hypothetical protein
MALARLVTFVPLTLIKSADVNGEINNILNNSIALISPTTGPINFNLVAHTNLVPTALSATSGSTGQALTISAAGTPVWASVASTNVTGLRVLQTVSGAAAGSVNATTTSFADSGLSVAITPASTNSRIVLGYSARAFAVNLTGVNQTYEAQIATSSGAITGTDLVVGCPTGGGGAGCFGTVAWNFVTAASTGPYPTTYKVQHLENNTSGASSTISNFTGYLMELSS